MIQEIKALSHFVNFAKEKEATAIFVGDFNMKLFLESTKKGHDNEVLNAIDKLSKEGYVALFTDEEVGTMASWKKTHINDNILVPKNMHDKNLFFPGILAPLESFPLPRTNPPSSICRDVDFDRLAIPLFTDHWPVTAYVVL